MLITKNRLGIRETRELENMLAETARLAATVDYVAMMADVELPEEEAGKTEGESNEQR